MEINIQESDGMALVALVGQIDGNTAADIQTSVLETAQGHPQLLLDMSGVSYMSSAGLRLLLQLHRTISENGGRLLLVGLSEELQETMSATGFLDFFEIYPSVDDALAALSQ
jgi:anti-sigma B factor antagonist